MAELIPEGGTTAFPLPDVLTSQPILIADVPVTTAGGTYSVVYFRDPPGPDPEIGTTLDGSIEIVAVPAGTPPSFTDIKRVLNFGNSSATPTLQGLIPYPQLEIALADEGNMDDRPAGGSLQITVPPNVEIQSVFESRTLGQTSMVRFVKNMDSNGVTTSIAVSYVDIDRKIRRLRIAFSLTGTNPSPVVPSAFPITSQKLYRLNGTLLPDTDVVNAVGNKFVLGSIS